MADFPMPKHLARDGARFWTDVMSNYGQDFELFEAELLRLAAEALDRGAMARRALRRHGLTYLSPQGSVIARPEVSVERASRSAFAQLVRQLGLGNPEPEDDGAPDDDLDPQAGRVRPYSVRRRKGKYKDAKGALNVS